MLRFITLSSLIILIFLTGLCSAEIPKLINYQGMLTDNSGNPLNGTYSITFKIYNAESDGTKKWEETQSTVSVSNGLFNVILGSVTPINLDFSEDYWLDITVGAEHMPTRLKFTSVGYAYRARWADTASYASTGPWGVNNAWTFRITDTADTTLRTGGAWGIARYGNVLHGNADSTHVNLGVACTTGTSGQNYKYCTLGGGYRNKASGASATIAGGSNNVASGSYATVGGGWSNTASDWNTTVGGGEDNTASNWYATVGGGFRNTASGDRTTVGGGGDNTASDWYATIGGGTVNAASGYAATVGGGFENTASGWYATVGGGRRNYASGGRATVVGGYYDTASGGHATVAGGRENTASGDYSFAAGRRAKANHLGTFVWADSSVDADFASTGNNQFLIRAAGGVGIGTTSPGKTLTVNGSIGIQQSGTQKYHIDYYNGGLNFAESGVADYRLFIQDGGEVGIGTSGPTEKLDVNGTARLRSMSTGTGTAVVADGNGVLKKQSSSKRYKENIRGLEVDRENILQLNPVRFDWKTTGEPDIGLIAEEVEKAIPDLVVYDNEGKPDAVKYDKISLYLLGLVKELKAENEGLKRRIEALETNGERDLGIGTWGWR